MTMTRIFRGYISRYGFFMVLMLAVIATETNAQRRDSMGTALHGTLPSSRPGERQSLEAIAYDNYLARRDNLTPDTIYEGNFYIDQRIGTIHEQNNNTSVGTIAEVDGDGAQIYQSLDDVEVEGGIYTHQKEDAGHYNGRSTRRAR